MTTKEKDTWVYLSDVGDGGNMWIQNLNTKERIKTSRNQVIKQSEIGLRGYTLTLQDSGKYEETGEQVPMTEELWDEMVDAWTAHNGWIADWPHFQLETGVTTEETAAVKARLLHLAKDLPYEVDIIGLQRRFLMYFSDGGFNSQKFFDRAIPFPNRPPYSRDGSLRPHYERHWDHLHRDSNAPKPALLQHHSLRPCLYAGPAWVVRVRINGVIPLVQNCRMYVDDDGNFIASDWCQRQDYHTYGNGINLQLGKYNFASWLAGPCINFATQNSKLVIPDLQVRRVQVRNVLALVEAPQTFDEALKEARAEIKHQKFPEVRKDPGPITAEAMMDAFSLLPQALDKTAKKIKAREADCTIVSQLQSVHTDKPTLLKDLIPDWTLVLSGAFDNKKFADLRTLVAMQPVKSPQEGYEQYRMLFMHVRNWANLDVDTRVGLVRDLRSTVQADLKAMPGFYREVATGTLSDTNGGKAKPGQHPYMSTDLFNVIIKAAVDAASQPQPEVLAEAVP